MKPNDVFTPGYFCPLSYDRLNSCLRFLLLMMIFMPTVILHDLHGESTHRVLEKGDDLKPEIFIEIGTCTPAFRDSTGNTCVGYLRMQASATDNESPEDDLVFEYKIDLFNDGIGPHNDYDCWVGSASKNQLNSGIDLLNDFNPYSTNKNNPFDASGTYPLGMHKICWIVTDTSGNEAVLCQLFEVKDCTAPTPVCHQNIKIPFPTSTYLDIFAKDLDLGSYDNCSRNENLKFYLNGDSSATKLRVTCNDFISAGANDELYLDTQLWVEDETANTDYCRINITVEDIFNVCPNQIPKGSISGRVYSIRNRTDTILLKHVDLPQISDSGFYDLKLLDLGIYTFCPKKHSEYFDSVSTYDMILIQKHIQGLLYFRNDYQLYAADVNNSRSITASDISEIRNLVLRNIDSLRVNSWLIAPVVSPFPRACIDVFLGQGAHRVVNFRGYKIGDVNNLVSSPDDKLLIPNPDDSLRFTIKNQQIKKGDTVSVDFYSDNFVNIMGYQFTLKFDTQYLSFLNFVQNNLTTSLESNFGIRYQDAGFITCSWYDDLTSIETFKPDQILFTIQFIAKEDSDLCNLMSINSQLTPAEAYRDSFLLNNVVLEVCDVIIKTKEKNLNQYRVFPNPFEDHVTIQFTDDQQFSLDIELYSIEGKLMEKHTIQHPVSNWILSDSPLKQGIYLLGIRNKQNVVFMKLVKE